MIPMLFSMDLAAIRDALRHEREARIGSRAKLQELSGVAESTIYRIETDHGHVPRVSVLIQIIEATGLTLSEFFARIEGLPPTRQTDPESQPSTSTGAGDDRALSGADRSADAFIQRAFIAALAQEITGAVDRLIDARAKDRSSRPATSTATRRSRKTRGSTAR